MSPQNKTRSAVGRLVLAAVGVPLAAIIAIARPEFWPGPLGWSLVSLLLAGVGAWALTATARTMLRLARATRRDISAIGRRTAGISQLTATLEGVRDETSLLRRTEEELRRRLKEAEELLTGLRDSGAEQRRLAEELLTGLRDSGTEQRRLAEEYTERIRDLGERFSRVTEAIDRERTANARGLMTLYRQLEALLSILGTLGPGKPLPALRGWAISPDVAAFLVTHILEQRPRYIVEFGSGASTLVMSLALELNGLGRILSVDHDPHYLERTRSLLERFGQAERAQVALATLTRLDLGSETWDWYDPESIVLDDGIDLVVVDGPPGKDDVLVRYPALPFVHPSLVADSVVVLDDAKRAEEAATIDRWMAEFPDFEVEIMDYEKGLAVLRRTRPGGE